MRTDGGNSFMASVNVVSLLTEWRSDPVVEVLFLYCDTGPTRILGSGFFHVSSLQFKRSAGMIEELEKSSGHAPICTGTALDKAQKSIFGSDFWNKSVEMSPKHYRACLMFLQQ